MKYDYLIVGAGIYGATIARQLTDYGKKCLVIDRRNKVGGNCSTSVDHDIIVHDHGAHIFHTNDGEVWNFVNKFDEFEHFINSPIANYNGEMYNLPFNMNTFVRIFNISTPEEAKAKIEDEIQKAGITKITNLEEQAISLVGSTIYEKLIKGYTEKQWGRSCKELSPSIIKRLPVRFTFDNNYFNDRYQGIPRHGYTYMIEQMLSGIDVRLNTEYYQVNHNEYEHLIYTGSIDSFFNYHLGILEYRSLHFETDYCMTSNYQGNAVVNYTSADVPWTRIIEHRFFMPSDSSLPDDFTIITREYPKKFENVNDERYYPLSDEKNQSLYLKYLQLKDEMGIDVFFGGRLGSYKYLDMHTSVMKAFADAEYLIEKYEQKC